MVENNVHYHTDASFMKLHDQLFELSHTAFGVIGIGGIGPFKAIIILRVIAPVILVFFRGRLIDGSIVCHRQQLDMGHSQLKKVIQAGICAAVPCAALCHCKKLATMLCRYA